MSGHRQLAHQQHKRLKTLAIHARERAKERYGVDLTMTAFRHLEAAIRHNEYELMKTLNPAQFVAKVNGGGVDMLAVFDWVEDRITTFLPPDAAKNGYVAPHKAGRKQANQ